MTAEIVNLRQVRKRKIRSETEAKAAQNRITFGRSKAERSLTDALNTKAKTVLDQGRIEPDSVFRSKRPED